MGLALLVLLALAQEPAGISNQVFEVSGKVGRVNRGARTITILSAGVASAPIYAGPDHGSDNRRVFRVVQDRKLLEGLKAGDVVTITYTRAQAVSIARAP